MGRLTPEIRNTRSSDGLYSRRFKDSHNVELQSRAHGDLIDNLIRLKDPVDNCGLLRGIKLGGIAAEQFTCVESRTNPMWVTRASPPGMATIKRLIQTGVEAKACDPNTEGYEPHLVAHDAVVEDFDSVLSFP